jgi:hypothetical protein
MLKTAPKYPTDEMFALADQVNQAIDRKLITVDFFLSHYQCSYSELARLSGSSVSKVKSWFDRRGREPDFEARYRLTQVHKFWNQ